MFKLFRISARVEDLERAFAQLKQELKFYQDELAKMDIKVLESRKVYARKLKNLVDKEGQEEMSEAKGINNSVILPYNGA